MQDKGLEPGFRRALKLRRLASTDFQRLCQFHSTPTPYHYDDAVLATAQAAKAYLIVSGDRKHLLILKRFEGIPIVTAAQAVAMVEAA